MQKLRIKHLVFQLVCFVGKVALSLGTFIVGVAAAILLAEVAPPTVTLCQLARNPAWYQGRVVKVEADGQGGGLFADSILIEDTSCPSLDAWSSVSLAENVEPVAETRQLFTKSDSDYFKARVVVTGRFDPNKAAGCYGPKFGLEATKVELKSKITTEPKRKPAHK